MRNLIKPLFMAAAAAALSFAALTEAQTVYPFSTAQSGVTSANANTFTVALAAAQPAQGQPRRGCYFQNTSSSATIYIYVGTGAATTTNSYQLAPNAAFSCATQAGTAIQDQIQIASSAASTAYVGTSQ